MPAARGVSAAQQTAGRSTTVPFSSLGSPVWSFTRRAARMRVAGRAVVACAALAALLSGVPAQAAPGGAGPAGVRAGRGSGTGPGSATARLIAWADRAMASPSDTGASDLVNLGAGGWQVASSATAAQSGAVISAPGFDAASWLPVTNDDAGAPGTGVEAL